MKHLSRFDIEAIADKYVQAYMALPDVRNTQISLRHQNQGGKSNVRQSKE